MTYRGICKNRGIKVDKENALVYALKSIVSDENILKDFTEKMPQCSREIEEFFYSGDWTEVREDDE